MSEEYISKKELLDAFDKIRTKYEKNRLHAMKSGWVYYRYWDDNLRIKVSIFNDLREALGLNLFDLKRRLGEALSAYSSDWFTGVSLDGDKVVVRVKPGFRLNGHMISEAIAGNDIGSVEVEEAE